MFDEADNLVISLLEDL